MNSMPHNAQPQSSTGVKSQGSPARPLIALTLAAISLAAVLALSDTRLHAQANDGARTAVLAPVAAHCVTLELYIHSNDSRAKESIDAIHAYFADKRGVHLKTYDVDHDAQGASRLKTIASAYKLGDPELPLVYGLNATASSIATSDVWRERLSDLLRVEVFTRKGCPRCARAKEYLPTFIKKYPGLQVQIYEVLSDPRANQRFADLAARHRIGGISYPGFWVCQHLVIGFDNEKNTAARLDDILNRWTFECRLASRRSDWPGRTKPVTLAAFAIPVRAPVQDEIPTEPLPLPISGEEPSARPPEDQYGELPLPNESQQADNPAMGGTDEELESLEIPWLGRLSARRLGMPLFTLAIGLVDGFNPCAMWVLLFLLSVLVNLQSRWKIFAVAGTFVVVSGLAYLAFMAAWLNVLLLVGFLRWVQIVLACLALFVGSVHIKDYFAFKKGISLSIPESAKPRIYEQIRRVVTAENLTAAILGAIVLAVLVNIIELLCTAGLPALYTQILSQQGYPLWEHYAYLGLYIVAYMFDDTVMLSIVIITLGRHKLQQHEGRWLKLVSGLVIFGLGVVLLVKPQWLE